MASTPKLSVLLATPDNFATLRRTVDALRRQSVASDLEVVFIIPIAADFDPAPGELDGFHSYQVVEHPVAGCLAEARVAGVHASRASFVVVGEDHSFPHRAWADAILAAHAKGHRVVGVAMRNPRPDSALGWADMITNFLPFIYPVASGPSPILPGHNTSYDRQILLGAGERLIDYMQVEVILHFKLAEEGETLWLEGRAVTTHHNLLHVGRFVHHKWLGGLLFGSLRTRDWPLRKRLMVGLLSPVIPPLRLWRMRGALAKLHRRQGCVIRAFPWLIVALICHGAGEGIGTLFGHGRALDHYWKCEFHRLPPKKRP